MIGWVIVAKGPNLTNTPRTDSGWTAAVSVSKLLLTSRWFLPARESARSRSREILSISLSNSDSSFGGGSAAADLRSLVFTIGVASLILVLGMSLTPTNQNYEWLCERSNGIVC